MSPETLNDGTQLDPKVLKVMRAIRQIESGGDFNAVGDNGTSAGAFQWNNGPVKLTPGAAPANFVRDAQSVGLNGADFSPANQNKVAYFKIKGWKDEGLQPEEIAAKWNGAKKDASGRFTYINPDYGVKFRTALGSPQTNTPSLATSATPQQVARPSYGAMFPYEDGDNPLVAGFKALGNLPSSVYGLGKSIFDIATNPIDTAKAIGGAAIGGAQKLTGDTDPSDQYSQTFDSFALALKDRYGSLDALTNTATNDPFGFGADIASIVAGGAGVAGRGSQVARMGENIADATIGPVAGAINRAGRSVVGGTNTEALAAAGRAGDRLGEAIAIPASGFTANQFIRQAEQFVAGDRLAGQVQKASDQLELLAQKLVADTGGFDDLGNAGQQIAKALTAFESGYKTASGKLYDTVTEKVGDITPSTSFSTGAISKILNDKASVGDASDTRFFREKLGVLTGSKIPDDVEFITLDAKGKPVKQKTYPVPTFTTLRKIRTDLGRKIDTGFDDPFVRSNKGQLIELYSALTRDIENTVRIASELSGDKALLQDLRKANKIYSDGRREIATGYARTIRRLGEAGQYSKLALDLIKPSTAAEDIPRIFAVLGENGASQVRSAMLQKIIGAAKNVDGEFTPKGILREMKKYEKDDKLKSILTADQYSNLEDLGKLSEALGSSQKILEGSQTAFLLKTMAQFGAIGAGAYDLVTGNIIGAAQKFGAALAPEVAGAFIASNTGQKLLRFGIEKGSSVKAIASEQGFTFAEDSGTVNRNGNTPINPAGNGGSDYIGVPERLGTDFSEATKTAKVALSAVPLVELANAANFNLEAARSAGYSDDEILELLSALSVPSTS